MESIGPKTTDRLLKALKKNPKVDVYLLLRTFQKPVARADLLTHTGLSERVLDRALQWLQQHRIIDRIKGKDGENYYYIVP